MSLRDLNRRHLWLVSTYSTRHAVRGGTGLVYLLLTLACGIVVAGAVLAPVEQAKKQKPPPGAEALTDEQIVDYLVAEARPVVEWAVVKDTTDLPEEEKLEAVDAAQEWASYLLDERPALLSAIMLILIFSLPFLISCGAFNQLSGDVQTRGLRFQLLRTERANIYFGRFLGTAAYSAIVLAILVVTIVVYLGLQIRIYDWGDLIAWGGWGYVALVILSVPYIAVCSLISAYLDSPFGSLAMCVLAIGGVPLVALLGSLQWEKAAYVKWLLPWGIQNNLLHHSGGMLAVAVAACLGYSALFLALGYRHFAKRDL
jgi:hypothetical protein